MIRSAIEAVAGWITRPPAPGRMVETRLQQRTAGELAREAAELAAAAADQLAAGDPDRVAGDLLRRCRVAITTARRMVALGADAGHGGWR